MAERDPISYKNNSISAKILFLLLMTIVICFPLVTGCSAQNRTAPTKSTKEKNNKKKAAIPVANPKFPGNYETVEVDGAELLQGRFPIGKHGGTLVKSMIGSDPKTFNVWVSSDSISTEMGGLMWASLLNTDMYTGESIPYMAKSFTQEEDGKTYTTVLRKGLKWSDGKPITSADVEFTFNKIIAGGYGNVSMRDVISVGGVPPKITSVDKLTNKFETTEKFAPFLRVMGGMPIAPKHVIEPILKAKNGRKKFMGFWGATINPKTLVTSGPFILERFVPSQRIEFKGNKNYFMVNKDGDKLPYLGKLVYTSVPDVQTNLLKFKGLETDITQIRSRDTFEMMKEQKRLNFSLSNLGQSLGSIFLGFNMNKRSDPKTKKPYVDPVKSKWFNDVNFRQAINHILNRDNMVANYLKGLGYPSFSSISPVSPFYNNKLDKFEPDLKDSMSLLEKSGFKKNKDGQLEDKDGNMVEFDLVTQSGGTFLPAISNMAIEDMKKLGMKVNYQEINFNIMIDKLQSSFDWQCCVMGLTGDPLEPNNGANVYKSNGRLHFFDLRIPDKKTDKVNVTDARDWEKEIDKLFETAAITMEKSKRKALYDEFQQIMYEQAPFIYLCNGMNIIATRNTVKNYEPTQLSQQQIGLHNIEEIWKEDNTSTNDGASKK